VNKLAAVLLLTQSFNLRDNGTKAFFIFIRVIAHQQGKPLKSVFFVSTAAP